MSKTPLWEVIEETRRRRLEMSAHRNGYADTLYAIADHLLPEEEPGLIRDHDEAVRRAERRRLRSLLLAEADAAWREETQPRAPLGLPFDPGYLPGFYES